VVTDPSAPAKRVTYAQLVEGKRTNGICKTFRRRTREGSPPSGNRRCARTGRDKVTGKGKYSGDILLPGLLHARLVRPPAHGATLKDVDTSAAEQVPGVRVVKDREMVAVLHERRDVADKALGLVKAQFNAARPARTIRPYSSTS